jgi:hypothetical protein
MTRPGVMQCARSLVDVCLQETKLNVINQHLVFALFGINFCDFAYLPASNTRGDPNCREAVGRVHLGRPRRLLFYHGSCTTDIAGKRG